MKVVLDTNVLLAGLATRGLCEAVLDLCIEQHTVVLSQHIVDEFARHYHEKFGMTREETKAAVAFLREHAELVEPAPVPPGSCRDPDDLAVLGTGIAAGAACIVTGDRDLLDVGEFQGVPILSPRVFYERVR